MRLLCLSIFVAAGLAVAHAALAFGTIHGLGQNAEHERITRHAFAKIFGKETLDELAGARGNFGAVGAPDNPARGLMHTKPAHCDGGDYMNVVNYPHSAADARGAIMACRQWMDDHLNKAVDAAAALLKDGRIDDAQIPTHIPCVFTGRPGRAKCNVLEEFGIVLHAAQDFYSHSNWVDEAAPGPVSIANPPGIGRDARAPFLDLRRPSPIFPENLMTGCYEGPVTDPDGISGCKGRVTHFVLNKDKGQIDPTIGGGTTTRGKIGSNFARAVNAAIRDSVDKWVTLRERIVARYGVQPGGRMICALIEDDPTKVCQ